MSRNIIIPPVNAPGKDAASGTMELTLSLVGSDGLPLPVGDVANTLLMHGLGVHTISAQQLVLTLPTQDELPDTTYYRVQVRQGRDQYTKDVQLPSGGDMTWAQFLGLDDPVTGGLAWAARLLPEGATDGQFATYDAGTGTWIASTVAPGAGVEEAPVDGTPYARQDAGWVAAGTGSGTGDVSDGDTLTTGLTFPLAGLHILDTNASHDLILSPGSNLTADRTLTFTTGDSNRSLTFTNDASIGGTNTGDQDLSGYSLTSHNHSGTYDPAGTAASAVLAHAGAADPHTVYALESSLGGAALLNVGTTTGTVAAGDDSRLSDARTPTSHVHGNISNAGAIGTTANLPVITTTSGVLTAGAFGTGATNFCVGNDSRLSDARTPSAHASSHASGQSDAIKLDDLAAPDDNTDLNASTTKHGLLPKLSNVSTEYLSGTGVFSTPAGGSATQAFGTIVVSGQSNVVADAAPDTLTLVAGTNITITTDAGADSITIAAAGGAGAIGDLTDVGTATATSGNLLVADGDSWESKAVSGDATLANTGAVTIANGAVSLAKMANLAQDQFIGRVTASTGVPETATITAAARTVLDDTTVAAMLATMGGQIKLTRVTASLTTANLTATVNAHHVLTISDMTAARSFVITAGVTEGDLISWECITAAPATAGYEMVLIGDTGITLVLGGTDRTATADASFRYLIAGETGVLRWDATASKWRLVSDGRIAQKYITKSAVNQSFSNSTGTKMNMASAGTDVNIGAGIDYANNKIVVRRAGTYSLSQLGLSPSVFDAGDYAYIFIYVNNANVQGGYQACGSGTNVRMYIVALITLALGVGDYIEFYLQQTEGGSVTWDNPMNFGAEEKL
jgi:hypothetical protein